MKYYIDVFEVVRCKKNNKIVTKKIETKKTTSKSRYSKIIYDLRVKYQKNKVVDSVIDNEKAIYFVGWCFDVYEFDNENPKTLFKSDLFLITGGR